MDFVIRRHCALPSELPELSGGQGALSELLGPGMAREASLLESADSNSESESSEFEDIAI